MYINYFGLAELPFSIAPNPDFLYMSDRHREALTHLTYGLGDTGGFVLLTGEVGTGKTTVSRCLLAQLPENTQVAFILNPTLSAQELLATLCDELKIRYRKTGATLKTLTDKIQEKLLKNHQANINTILIIDEAQHLQPEVLEQLRLLTNLETNTKKLLQVILIGQPELQQLLQRQDLRQLAQRITARYHLMPLNKQEVVQYIKHRLDVAKCPRMLFNDSAMSQIHKLSKGIPRLINLLCDRALLKAYGCNQTLVNKNLVISASYEALGREKEQAAWSTPSMFKLLTGVSVLVAVLVTGALATGFWFANQKSYLNNSVVLSDETKVKPENSAANNTLNTAENEALIAQKNIIDKSNLTTISQPLVVDEGVITPKVNPVDNSLTTAVTVNDMTDENEQIVAETNSTKKVLTPDNTIDVKVKQPAAKDFKVEKVEGVSDELLTLFQNAIEETEVKKTEINNTTQANSNNPDNINSEVDSPVSVNNNAPSLMDMPMWVQNGVPKLNFQMHLYQSDNKGSVKVNGQEKFVGDVIENKVEIVSIKPQQVILSYQGEVFSLPSLASWE